MIETTETFYPRATSTFNESKIEWKIDFKHDDSFSWKNNHSLNSKIEGSKFDQTVDETNLKSKSDLLKNNDEESERQQWKNELRS